MLSDEKRTETDHNAQHQLYPLIRRRGDQVSTSCHVYHFFNNVQLRNNLKSN